MLLESTENAGSPSVTKPPLVLAVDDSEDNLGLIGQIIELLGCSFMGASDGQTALVLAKQSQPALVLLDICMPDVDGIEVVRRLKQDPQTANIPVVAITGLAKAEDRDRILAAGCADCITKPFVLENLEATLCRHLNLQPFLF
ncbi:MAG: response regulator [Oscillatoria princeps RMCB-10]|nr:response regulator [Oscillatoria princeps RMCB-10]